MSVVPELFANIQDPARKPGRILLWIAIGTLCFGILGCPVLWRLAIHTFHRATVVGALRNLNALQQSYAAAHPARGFACALNDLGRGPGEPPIPDYVQDIIDHPEGNSSGYQYAISNCSKTSYRITAIPRLMSVEYHQSYCTDETSQTYLDPDGSPHCTELVQ